MRNINFIVWHCSASPNAKPLTREQLVAEHKARGFRTIGYHYVIEPDGKVILGRPESEVGAHVEGHNSDSIGICMIGYDAFTAQQWDAARNLAKAMTEKYPKAKHCGHRDFSPDLNHNGKIEPNEWIKLCPNFDVKSWQTFGFSPVLERMYHD